MRWYSMGNVCTNSVSYNGVVLQLQHDQIEAIKMSDAKHPVMGIQAAYGTGKTIIGALIAARAARSSGALVIVISTTNTAVAQFADTIMRLDEFKDIRVIRFISDTALMEGAPTTPMDLPAVLKELHEDKKLPLSPGDRSMCKNYQKGRAILENFLFQPNSTIFLSEKDREEYTMAEKEVSRLTRKVVKILFRVRTPNVLCLSTAALLNSTGKKGIFRGLLNNVEVVIGDEASQIPEPVFVAVANSLRDARHIYIGDVRQLAPHIRCPRTASPAQYGARGVIDLLASKEVVPVASLCTTY
ncbi:unnamed protein product [Heligmosomoides polygyrus]|uniref:AAA_11 domain-containing protein n=1 Tax=Heligmosomoides polygyrus TaxID=6339 RepID=A0A183GAB5_HELPZ|nr:unnamed protein product [Heligmosomoides polygyrus]